MAIRNPLARRIGKWSRGVCRHGSMMSVQSVARAFNLAALQIALSVWSVHAAPLQDAVTVTARTQAEQHYRSGVDLIRQQAPTAGLAELDRARLQSRHRPRRPIVRRAFQP